MLPLLMPMLLLLLPIMPMLLLLLPMLLMLMLPQLLLLLPLLFTKLVCRSTIGSIMSPRFLSRDTPPLIPPTMLLTMPLLSVLLSHTLLLSLIPLLQELPELLLSNNKLCRTQAGRQSFIFNLQPDKNDKMTNEFAKLQFSIA